MPRISEHNDRYRTKKEICEDVAVVLSSPLRWGTKYAVLADAIWVWSEFDGKFDGCHYWSRSALQIGNNPKQLIHEHVVPKSIIIEKLARLNNPSPAAVHKVLSTYCIGVIVTREEDKRLNSEGLRAKMPDGGDGKDVWARYRQVRIEWVNCYANGMSLPPRST